MPEEIPKDAPPKTARQRRALITDLEVVDRRARELADQNMRFRTWVKYKTELTSEAIDAEVKIAADTVWRDIDCTACGQCCRVLKISVDDADIARLAKRLKLTPEDFAKRYVRNGKERLFKTQPCPFLKDNACTVYEDRPDACRAFPYLHEPQFNERMLLIINQSLICPVTFNALEELKRRLPWRRPHKPRPDGK